MPDRQGKTIAILQSNYIPWKGYFDLIAAVDEFVIYDSVQFTKNDWRNRNKVRTRNGLQWLSVPVGKDINRLICEVTLSDAGWQRKHWETIRQNYSKAPFFHALCDELERLYLQQRYQTLSGLNRSFIEFVCDYLSISTTLTDDSCYSLDGDPSERLVSICRQADASAYLSGPAAAAYLDETLFERSGISVNWFNYDGYPEYNQCFDGFEHFVSVLDLLLCCGPNARQLMKCGDNSD